MGMELGEMGEWNVGVVEWGSDGGTGEWNDGVVGGWRDGVLRHRKYADSSTGQIIWN